MDDKALLHAYKKEIETLRAKLALLEQHQPLHSLPISHRNMTHTNDDNLIESSTPNKYNNPLTSSSPYSSSPYHWDSDQSNPNSHTKISMSSSSKLLSSTKYSQIDVDPFDLIVPDTRAFKGGKTVDLNDIENISTNKRKSPHKNRHSLTSMDNIHQDNNRVDQDAGLILKVRRELFDRYIYNSNSFCQLLKNKILHVLSAIFFSFLFSYQLIVLYF